MPDRLRKKMRLACTCRVLGKRDKGSSPSLCFWCWTARDDKGLVNIRVFGKVNSPIVVTGYNQFKLKPVRIDEQIPFTPSARAGTRGEWNDNCQRTTFLK